jgi:antitoxin CptB
MPQGFEPDQGHWQDQRVDGASRYLTVAMKVDSPFRDTSVGDPLLDGLAGDKALNERALSKLRWRSRRGLLENDLFIQKFFKQYESQLTVAHARGLYALMDLSDNDLLDLLLKRKEMPDNITQEEALEVLNMLRH